MTPEERRAKLYAEPPPGENVAWGAFEGAQAEFMACPAFESLFGGAAGPGKTSCLISEGLRHVDHPNHHAVFFRRTCPELDDEVIPRAKQLFSSIKGLTAKFSARRCTFSTKARFKFSHLEKESDVLKHHSTEYTYAAFDELTSFTEKQYRYLLSRLRSAHGLEPYVRAGTNPGGPGAEWVFKRWAPWLDPEFSNPNWKACGWSGPRPAPGEPIWFLTNEETGEDIWVPRGTPMAKSRCFHPAKLEDNPALGGATGDYAATLATLDPLTRKQLREGDWMARPAPRTFFRREWMPVVDALPPEAARRVRRVRWWDRAATEEGAGSNPDFTAAARISYDEVDDLFYIEDLVHFRAAPGGVKSRLLQTTEDDGYDVEIALAQDPGAAGVFEVTEYIKALTGYPVSVHRETGDKLSYAKACSAVVAPPPGQTVGRFRVVRGPWNGVLFAELEAFPTKGVKDDIVDTVCKGFRVLAEGGGCTESAPPAPAGRGTSRRFSDNDDDDTGGFGGLPGRRW
jgi:phage terminase large subunit-like protein